MPSGLSAVVATARRRVGWFVRDRFPDRRVTRDVQGVRLVLPWSHRLPDYAVAGSIYGQNLVELARLLTEAGEPVTVLDIGANVGDSAVQILNATDGRVLCVEADRAYLEYLHLNTDDDPRVTVVEGLLTVDGSGTSSRAVRVGGTTRFAEGDDDTSMPLVTPDHLRRTYPHFERLRLVKSDTDGHDVSLVPAVAEAWADSKPVLFFEYDPHLIRLAGLDPLAVWPRLQELGYCDVAVWNHGGAPVGRGSTATICERAAVLDDFPAGRSSSRTYWDVAVAHADDVAAISVLDALVAPDRTF